MADLKSLCKVSVDAGDTNDMFLLCTGWESGHAGFDIALTDTENAWTGTISEDELGHMAKRMKVSFDNFIMETQKALSRQNVGSLNFEYSLKEMSDNEYKFTWKKYLPQDKIRIQLGQVTLTLKDETSDVFKEIIEYSIQAGLKVQENITSLESDNLRLSSERAGALKRLEKAVASKEEMETDLYSKFVVVVNDKKRKIRELKDEVEELKSGVPSTTSSTNVMDGHSVKAKKATAALSQRLHQAESEKKSDDESDVGHGSDYNTDEEREKLQASKGPSPSKKSKINNQKENKTSLLDTSDDLGLDLEEEENSPVVATTRRRGRRAVVKKTPSKAIIPKVPSSDQKKTPGGKPSMKKSDSHNSHLSNTSKRSSDASCEDLLADL